MAMVLRSSRLRLTQAIYFGEPASGAGTGTVTSIAQGSGITMTPNPTIATGTVKLGPLTTDWAGGNFNANTRNSTGWFNVVAYGADPTGAASSTVAVQAATTAAAAVGGTIYFPRGVYDCTSGTLTVSTTGTVVFRGDGTSGSTIKLPPAADGFHITNANTNQHYIAFYDLGFLPTGVVTAGAAIHSDAANQFSLLVEGCRFGNHFVGVQMGTNWMSSISHCQFASGVAGNTDILIDNTINDDQGDNIIGPGNTFWSNGNYHVHQMRGGGTRIVSNKFIGPVGRSIYVDNPVGTTVWVLMIQNNSMEGSVTAANIEIAPAGNYGTILIDGNEIAPTTGLPAIVIAPTATGTAKYGLISGNFIGESTGTHTISVKFNPIAAGGADVWNIDSNTFVLPATAAVQLPAVSANLINLTIGQNQYIPNGAAPYVSGTFSASSGFGPGIFTKAGFNTVSPTREVDINGTLRSRGIAAPAVSEANSGTIYFDSGLNKFRVSLNGGAYVDLVGSAGLTGTGVAGRLPYWSSATNLLNAANLYVDSVNNRLGLNVAVPAYRLDMDGDINLTTGSMIRTNAAQVFKNNPVNNSLSVGEGVNPALTQNSVAVGVLALAADTVGTSNTAVGFNAGNAIVNGGTNTAIGASALSGTTDGSNNTAIGRNAGVTNTTGSNNVFVGEASDVSVNNLTNAVAIGYQASVGANDSMSLGNASMKVGIHTTTPALPLDVDGAVATRHKDIALANGTNSDIALTDTSWVRVTGPTGGFGLGGFTGGVDGRHLTVFNTTAQVMTIVNLDAGSVAANQITTLTGADVVLPARTSSATFIYEDASDLWVLVSYN